MENQIEEIAKILADNFNAYDGKKYEPYDFEWCAYMLQEKDYRKIEQGEWVIQDKEPRKIKSEAKCSICGRDVVYQIIDNKWQFENYCPHCGAKMKGKNENKNN